MTTLLYNLDEIRDPYVLRQASEHMRLDQFARLNNKLIEYIPIENSRIYPHPPIVYKIVYKLRSIVGIDQDQMPIYDDRHEMQIRLAEDFPEQPADCKMLSTTWHPNIKSEGSFKGAICTNSAGFGSLFFLDELITRIGEFLQYKRYMAEERPPWPEDQTVARWVREVGEPKGIIDKSAGKGIDNSMWKLWEDEALPEEDLIEFIEKAEERPITNQSDEDADQDDPFSISEK